MENNEFVEMKIRFRKDDLKKINEYVQYQNLRNDIKKRKKPIDLNIEDFITGCVNAYLNKLKYPIISNIDNLDNCYILKNRFKELMEKRKLKQKELSEATQIAAPIISRILANENQPSLDTFIRLWIFFDCPPLSEVLYRE